MTTDEARVFGDAIYPFQIEDLGLRGRVVRMQTAVEQVTAPHAYPTDVASLVAQSMVLTASLASALKYDGIFTLQVQGDGPVGLLMADITSDGDMRSYARYDADGVSAADTRRGLVPRLLGAGHLAFTVDQGADTDRYQAITELTGASMAECAQAYFRQSEQMETVLHLASAAAAAGQPARAAALMIQRLPGQMEGTVGRDHEDEEWRRAAILAASLTDDELLDAALPVPDLLYRLYHEDGVRLFDEKPLRHACRCSRQRVARTLASFPKAEIEDLSDDGVVTVTCEFCLQSYAFDANQVEELFPA